MTTAQDVMFTYVCGLGTTMASAPMIHPFNVVAAAAARTQLTSGKAVMQTYRGLGANTPNSLSNFESGLLGHCSKELVRSWGRIAGVVYIEKEFKRRLTPAMAPHALACVMATYEVIFANPADVWKSYRSTGLQTKVADLFKGSLGNFCRQYGMWFVWSSTIPVINRQFERNGIETKSVSGIMLRSVLQAIACTLVTYPMELGLRTVQVRCDQYPVKNLTGTLRFVARAATNPSCIRSESAYFRVFADLVRANGVRGLGLGMSAKMVGNTALLCNANFLPMVSEMVGRRVGRSSAASTTK